MPVPTQISELSQTPASNSPVGTVDVPSSIDDYQRTHAAFIATLRDGKGFTSSSALASGATTDIGAQNALFVDISGTTTITSFGTNFNGPRFLRFAGALTLTHNATTLILPGGVNITTAAGDTMLVIPKTTAAVVDGWVVIAYLSKTLTSGTAQASTSGTSIDFTGIPAWVKRVTINFNGVSTNGTSNWLFQVGDSGGVEASGYAGAGAILENATAISGANFTAGFGIPFGSAANVVYGSIVLSLIDSASFLWAASGTFALSSAAATATTAGSKALTATLDRVRITTVAGVDTFDAGVINILYE